MQNNIAKFRKEAGISQQELADAISVSRKTIST
ncbi:MAG: helix-turn-helix transcriptional regulator, partial [Pseudoalteromonas shioyasakiensis]